MLREQRPDLRIGFFLHIPFPPTELFSQIPWRRQLLEGLLGADLVGFQLPGAAANFVRLVRARVGHKTAPRHRLPARRAQRARPRAFPISIDAKGLEELARTPETEKRADEIRQNLGNPKKRAARRRPARLHQGHHRSGCAPSASCWPTRSSTSTRSVFVQVATPSRERVEQYRVLRDDIDRLVGRINGDLGHIGPQPITLPALVVRRARRWPRCSGPPT